MPRARLIFSGAFLALAAVSGRAPGSWQDAAGDPRTKSPDQTCFEQLLQSATVAKLSGLTKDAIALYSKAIAIRPDDPDALRQLASLLTERRDCAAAEGVLHNLLSLEPKNGLAWAELGICEFELGHYLLASKHLRYSRVLTPESTDQESNLTIRSASRLGPEANYRAGLAMITSGMSFDAYALLTEEAEFYPDSYRLRLAIGIAALHLTVPPDRLNKDQAELAYRVGEIAETPRASDSRESTRALTNLLAEQPTTPGLHFALGSVYLFLHRYDEALAEMQRDLSTNPRDPQALALAAWAGFQINQKKLALSYAEKAAEIAPDLFYPHYVKGKVLLESDRMNEAIEELKRAVALDPESPAAHYLLSSAYRKTHHEQEYQEELSAYLFLQQNIPPPEWAPAPSHPAAGRAGCPAAQASP